MFTETLRLHSPVASLLRQCSKDYELDGVKINKGMFVQIPIAGLHMDPRYFPKPEVYDPDRFTSEAKAQRHNYAYLPFGNGPRNCIGK